MGWRHVKICVYAKSCGIIWRWTKVRVGTLRQVSSKRTQTSVKHVLGSQTITAGGEVACPKVWICSKNWGLQHRHHTKALRHAKLLPACIAIFQSQSFQVSRGAIMVYMSSYHFLCISSCAVVDLPKTELAPTWCPSENSWISRKHKKKTKKHISFSPRLKPGGINGTTGQAK